MLPSKEFDRILNELRKNFKISDICEISTETTLHNLCDEKLCDLKEMGFNRISIGIQTFDTEGRKFFNRTGDKEYALKRLGSIRNLFDKIVATDIIYNYPNQSRGILLEDARIIKEYQIDSTSFYSLMMQKGSVLSNTLGTEDTRLKLDKQQSTI